MVYSETHTDIQAKPNSETEIALYPKTPERERFEAERLDIIIQILRDEERLSPPHVYFNEILSKAKIISDLNQEIISIPAARLLQDHKITTLCIDEGSPFGKRQLLCYWGSLQDMSVINREYFITHIKFNANQLAKAEINIDPNLSFTIEELVLRKLIQDDENEVNKVLKCLGLDLYSDIYPDKSSEQGKIDFDNMRKDELGRFFALCNRKASIKGNLVTITSGVSNVNSVSYPLHAQCISLKLGIVLNQDYLDEDKFIDILDLPRFIKRSKKLRLMYNLSFVGRGKVAIVGLYPFGNDSNLEPTFPQELSDKKIKKFLSQLYAIMPGSVECFTNAITLNKLSLKLLNQYGYGIDDLRANIDSVTQADVLAVKNWIDYHHKQFDPRTILADLEIPSLN